MIIDFWRLESSYCMVQFILPYKLWLTIMVLLASCLVKLNSLYLQNWNSTLQNWMSFLCQTIMPHSKKMFTFLTKLEDTVLSNVTSISTSDAIYSTVQ